MPDSPQFLAYKYNIRNMAELDDTMITNIRNMTHEEKMELILLYNDFMIILNTFINSLPNVS